MLRRSLCAAIVTACFVSAASASPRAYVINNGSASLTVLDLGTRTVLSQISTGSGPLELYILADNRTALLTENGANMLRKIDLISGQTASVPVGTGPGSIVVSPDLQYAYIANETSNNISVVAVNRADPTKLAFVRNVAVGTTPVQVNQSFDGKYVYAANAGSGNISVIDTASLAVVKTVPLPAGHPNQFAENINGKAFIPAPDANLVYVFDMTTNAMTATTLAVSKPQVIVFSPDYSKMYVLTQGSSIAIFDATTLRSLGTLTSGSGTNAVDMTITSDGKYAYVAFVGGAGARGAEIDVADLTALSLDPINSPLAGNSQPTSVSFDGNEDYVFATVAGSNQVVVIDPNTDTIVNRLTTGSTPLALVQLNQPYVPPGAIVDAAGFKANIAGGSIVSIFGEGLVETPGSATTVPLPTSLNGTQVLFNGVAAPLFFTSGLQINAVVPVSMLNQRTATLQIVGPNGTDISTITLATAAPGLFAVNQAGSGPGIIQRWPSYSLVSSSNAAIPGDYLIIYGTGFGQTKLPMIDGQGATAANEISGNYTVTVNGQPAAVSYIGQAPTWAGLYQLNIQLPQLAPGTYPLAVTVNGIASNTVTVEVGKSP